LVEVSAAIALLVVAIGLALGGYMYSIKNINEADIQNDLDIDVQLAMERLKRDLRLSSLDTMFYYPAGGGPYEAISFPVAYDSDGDGILEKDDEGKILWDETVVYHVRPTTPHQLVKTTFKPRDNSLSDAQRQAQIEAVVKTGSGAGTYNGQNASSHVIFQNLLHWKIEPKAGRFDAYSPVLTRDRASLGYMLLDPGMHDVTFKTVGKNSDASGYYIGVDQLFVSPSASPREGEAQLPAKSQSGAAAVAQYMPVGSWKGSHQLLFPASAPGHTFTLSMANDRWEETNFIGIGYQADDTRVEFDSTLVPRDHVVRLNGMGTSWEAAAQTATPVPGSVTNGAMANCAVRTLIKGAAMEQAGGWISMNGRRCKLTFRSAPGTSLIIGNVFIGESISTNSVDFRFYDESDVEQATFAGASATLVTGPATSDWIDLPIDREKSYVVAYSIANDPLHDAPCMWRDQNVGSTNLALFATTLAPGAGSMIANDKDWEDQGVVIVPTNRIFGLESLFVGYPEDGTYTSQVIDTHLAKPRYGDITWHANVPSGTALNFKVRSGNAPDLSDADSFETLTSFAYPRTVPASYNRYIQFQALMESDEKGLESPVLKDVAIGWAGQKQLVDVGGIFTKGPNYGVFEISIDGQPLRSALIVDLEIYKDTLTKNHENRRITSSLKVELTPRNSGL